MLNTEKFYDGVGRQVTGGWFEAFCASTLGVLPDDMRFRPLIAPGLNYISQSEMACFVPPERRQANGAERDRLVEAYVRERVTELVHVGDLPATVSEQLDDLVIERVRAGAWKNDGGRWFARLYVNVYDVADQEPNSFVIENEKSDLISTLEHTVYRADSFRDIPVHAMTVGRLILMSGRRPAQSNPPAPILKSIREASPQTLTVSAVTWLSGRYQQDAKAS